MKIAHVVCVFPPYGGGIGNSALEFSQMMSNAGHQVTVFTPKYRNVPDDGNQTKFKIIRIETFFKIGNGAFIPSLFFKLRNFDIVYLHYPFFGGAEIIWFFSFFSRKTKIILHYHMDVIGLPPLLKVLSFPSRIIERSLLNRVNIISVGSIDYVANSQIRNFYKKQSSKFYETFFPVNTSKFYPQLTKNNRKRKEILFVGGLDNAHYFKGLDILIDALYFLKDRDDWLLKIVGDGNLKQKFVNRCKVKKLDNRVVFLGSLSCNELAQKYRESDFFVLPSINKGEAFGIVLLEAMASGLPVIASDLAGVRKVFTDKEGLLIHPGDKNDLSDKIEYLLDNNDILKIMGKNARLLVKNKYSFEKISRRINYIVDNI